MVHDKPCVGFDQMILDFQKIYAEWVIGGSRETPISVHRDLQCNNGHITIQKRYGIKQGTFFVHSSIDERQLKDFCVRNKLDYRIEKTRNKHYNYDVLYISGSSRTFAESELNGLIGSFRERARSLQDLAQKFYESDMMKEVWEATGNIHGRDYSFCSMHLWRTEPMPCVVYNFKHYGYRDLETEEELIAFALAFCTRDWGTDPKGISWEHLDWYIDIQHDTDKGIMALHNMPKYRGIYLHEKTRVSDIPAPPPLKDFF